MMMNKKPGVFRTYKQAFLILLIGIGMWAVVIAAVWLLVSRF